MRYDFHTHSTCSDGSLTPEELVCEAKRLELTLALTDHNTTKGLPSFTAEATRQGVTAIPGIELSTAHDGRELHLLGLFLSPDSYDKLEALCEHYRALKEQSNLELIARLNNGGYALSYKEVQEAYPNGNINRVHVARILMAKGYLSSVNEAFATLLNENGPFYTPPARLGLFDAIHALNEVKALPILAHPLKEMDSDTLRRLLPAAIEAGLVGIETQHSSYDDAKQQVAAQIAEDFGLLPSGGSDFHGENKPTVMLGSGCGNVAVPQEVFDRMLAIKRHITAV